MKHLRLLSALILIMWSLLLMCGKSAAQSNQARDQNHAAKTDEHAVSSQNQQPVAPAFFAAILAELRDIIGEDVAKQKQEHADHNDWNTKPFWIMLGLNAALVLVGFAYTVVAYFQLGAINRQANLTDKMLFETRKAAEATTNYVELTRQMVKAADQSARAADLALNVERPYIFIESQRLSFYWGKGGGYLGSVIGLLTRDLVRQPDSTHIGMDFSFELRNRGKGVALVHDIRMRLVDAPQGYLVGGIPAPLNPSSKVMGRHLFFIARSIIGGGECSDRFETYGLSLPVNNWDAMNAKGRVPTFVVRVTYADVYGREYHSTPRFRLFRDLMLVTPTHQRDRRHRARYKQK